MFTREHKRIYYKIIQPSTSRSSQYVIIWKRIGKRHDRQAGEPTLREKDAEEDHGNGSAVKKIVAGGLAVLMAMAMGVVGLALIGAAILFMPMLGGLNE